MRLQATQTLLILSIFLTGTLSLPAGENSQPAQIIFDQPFDSGKTPILFVHGLFSSPETWEPMISSFRSNPEINNRYQFGLYTYPTNSSTVKSSARLRNRLDEVIRNIESNYGVSMHRNVIVVGHSMGGILAKSLISNSGDKLWNTAFNAPIETFNLSSKQKQVLVNAYRFEPRPYVQKVIFLATPHRGSILASGIAGKIAKTAIGTPSQNSDLIQALRQNNRSRLKPTFAKFLQKSPNSVASLQPNSPVTIALADLPIDSGAEFHSISGVKRILGGKSDGIVPLKSTILREAYCEVGIFSNHRVHRKRKAIHLTEQMILTDFDSMPRRNVWERLTNAKLAYFRLTERNPS